MALIKCKDCGDQVSSKAKTCPKCGAKVPQKTSVISWISLIIIITGGYVLVNYSSGPSASTKTAKAKAKPVKLTSWSHHTSADKMTGKKSAYASSDKALAIPLMDFPYQVVTAYLGIGCDGKSEWAYIGFNKAPNLADTDTKDGYNEITTRIKWNKKTETIKLTQDWGASFIHFKHDKSVISKIATSNSVVLELQWHGEQPTYFDLPLKGSAASITNIHALCATY